MSNVRTLKVCHYCESGQNCDVAVQYAVMLCGVNDIVVVQYAVECVMPMASLPACGVGGNGKRSWGCEWGPVWAEGGLDPGPVVVSRMLLLTLPN